MPLNQEDGIVAIKTLFIAYEDRADDPDFARGMIQAIVEIYEENGVNMTPILQDALADLLQRE